MYPSENNNNMNTPKSFKPYQCLCSNSRLNAWPADNRAKRRPYGKYNDKKLLELFPVLYSDLLKQAKIDYRLPLLDLLMNRVAEKKPEILINIEELNGIIKKADSIHEYEVYFWKAGKIAMDFEQYDNF